MSAARQLKKGRGQEQAGVDGGRDGALDQECSTINACGEEVQIQHMQGLRGYVGFVVPGLPPEQESTAVPRQDADAPRAGEQDTSERQNMLMTFNEVVELCTNLFLDDDEANPENEEERDGGEGIFLTGMQIESSKRSSDKSYAVCSIKKHERRRPLDEFWQWFSSSELSQHQSRMMKLQATKSMKDLEVEQVSSSFAHRPDVRGGAASARLIQALIPQVCHLLTSIHPQNLSLLHDDGSHLVFKTLSRKEAAKQHVAKIRDINNFQESCSEPSEIRERLLRGATGSDKMRGVQVELCLQTHLLPPLQGYGARQGSCSLLQKGLDATKVRKNLDLSTSMSVDAYSTSMSVDAFAMINPMRQDKTKDITQGEGREESVGDRKSARLNKGEKVEVPSPWNESYQTKTPGGAFGGEDSCREEDRNQALLQTHILDLYVKECAHETALTMCMHPTHSPFLLVILIGRKTLGLTLREMIQEGRVTKTDPSELLFTRWGSIYEQRKIRFMIRGK